MEIHKPQKDGLWITERKLLEKLVVPKYLEGDIFFVDRGVVFAFERYDVDAQKLRV